MARNTDLTLQAATIFLKCAQTTGDEAAVARGKIFVALGIRDPKTNRDDTAPFFRKYIEPWIMSEIEAGNLKSGQNWGVKIVANPGNVQVLGTIDGREGPNSSAKFQGPSKAATQAVEGFNFPTFEFWLSEEQVFEE
jgi:hypothetical protein